MGIKTTDTILGKPRGTIHDVYAYCERYGRALDTFLVDYIAEIFRLAPLVGMDPAILISQSAHECFNPETRKPWDSFWYRSRGNIAGLGITGDPRQNEASGRWATGTDAARAQIVHMAAYVHGAMFALSGSITDAKRDVLWDLRPYVKLDPRVNAVFDAKWDGTVRTIADLTGRWATDPAYHTKIVAKGNQLFGPGLPDQGESSMALPIPVFEKRIAPQGIPNRTGLAMASPSWVTIHEVGNRSVGADEEMHVRFVHNGGGGVGVSFHFVVGPTKACQIIELDEACWHASDGFNGTGNRDSIAIETVQIGDFDKTLWHLAWLCAELVVNPGRFLWRRGVPNPYAITDQVFTQHNWWAPDKKNCPQFIRERGLWPVLMGRIDQYIAAAKPAPEPKPEPTPTPEPTEPALPKGMSWKLVERLYNPLGIKDPDSGRRIVFSRNSKTAMAWFDHATGSIPAGKIWTAGQWGGLLEVIRRGDGGRVYQFVDYLHQVGPPREKEAA